MAPGRRKRWALGTAAAVAAAGVAGCGGGSSGGGGGDTVKVGLIAPVTGVASPWYPPIKQANELAVAEINKRGGVNGKQVELVIADSKTTPATAATQARRLVNEGAKLIIVEDIGADRDAAIQQVKGSQVPIVYAWSHEGGPADGGKADICYKNVWASGQVPGNWLPQPVEHLIKQQGWKDWYLLGNDYGFHHSAFPIMERVIKENGGVVRGTEYAPLGTTDYAATITKIKNAPPNTGIVNWLVGSDQIAFLKQWKAAGGSNDRQISFDMPEQVTKSLGKLASGILGSYDYYYTLETAGNKKFLAALKAKYGAKTETQSSLSEEGYEVLWLWKKAVDQSKSFDLDAVNKALTEVSLDGPRGNVKFLPNHHMVVPNILGQVQDDGLYKVIKDFGPVTPPDQCQASAYK
jgi:branched-chain amino acid transport system substrate-binding protein